MIYALGALLIWVFWYLRRVYLNEAPIMTREDRLKKQGGAQ